MNRKARKIMPDPHNDLSHAIRLIKQFWTWNDDDIVSFLPIGWSALGVAAVRKATIRASR